MVFMRTVLDGYTVLVCGWLGSSAQERSVNRSSNIRGTHPSLELPGVLLSRSQSSISRMLPLASAIVVSAAP